MGTIARTLYVFGDSSSLFKVVTYNDSDNKLILANHLGMGEYGGHDIIHVCLLSAKLINWLIIAAGLKQLLYAQIVPQQLLYRSLGEATNTIPVSVRETHTTWLYRYRWVIRTFFWYIVYTGNVDWRPCRLVGGGRVISSRRQLYVYIYIEINDWTHCENLSAWSNWNI